MYCNSGSRFRLSVCRSQCVLFFFWWILGLLLGSLGSVLDRDSFLPSLCFNADGGVSPAFGLFLLRFLPVMLSILFVQKVQLLVLLIFIKAVLFGFVTVSFYFAFGASVWVILILLLFSNLFSTPMLWLFWLGLFSEAGSFWLQRCVLAGVVIFLCSTLDVIYIAPFFHSLIIL